MKVLWVAMNPSHFDQSVKRDKYGGGGWISSLQDLVGKYAPNIQLGITFLYPHNTKKREIDNVTYFPIKENKKKGFAKLLYYWHGFKKENQKQYLPHIQNIIQEFKPDVIHLWGVENVLGSVCLLKDVPVVAHLQGFLSLYIYTYYPYGMNKYSFKWSRFSLNEWIYKNGFIFNEKKMAKRAKVEIEYLKNVPNVIGRTHWDKNIATFNNPNVNYFHINETLRSDFYTAKKWNKPRNNKFIIFSTLSETLYKGFDLVLKTAAILKEYNSFDFEWHIAGVNNKSEYTKFFEKICNLKTSSINVHLLGPLQPEQIIKECLSADLYVHPSYIDNSPNSLCEAQILGVPIIATNVGGISSLIENNITGHLIPANAPIDLSISIKDCYGNEEKWKDMAHKGMLLAIERHNPKNIINDLLKVYSSIAQN
ncbi:MAG: glycosyltransferase [Paraprevotella sp.]|nr:glycosyltransferase [Paraprevotella sp.]